MAEGFIKIWRKLRDSPLWISSTSAQRDVMLSILLNAEWKDTTYEIHGKVITVKSGQLLMTRRGFVMKCGKDMTENKLRSTLKRFEKIGFLTQEITQGQTLITVVNWGKYQDNKKKNNPEFHPEITQESPKKVPEITQESPRPHVLQDVKELRRRVRRVRREEGEEDICAPAQAGSGAVDESRAPQKVRQDESRRRPYSSDEVFEYFNKMGYPFDHREEADKLWDFYEANGWVQGKQGKPIRDWKAAARNWARNVKTYEPVKKGYSMQDYAEAFEKGGGSSDGEPEGNSGDVFPF